jgi:hypothetical protein
MADEVDMAEEYEDVETVEEVESSNEDYNLVTTFLDNFSKDF